MRNATRRDPTASRCVRVSAATGVSIRPIDASDRAALSHLYAALSPTARHDRFLGTCGEDALDSAVARFAAGAGFVAVLDAPGPGDGQIVGHALWSEDRAGGAEIAFVVADAWRLRGIGTRLMQRVVDAASRAGLRRLTAATYARNGAMRRVLLGAGLRLEHDEIDGGVEELTLSLR
jgi:RimJ/RimL family protein N-acetyltransferase